MTAISAPTTVAVAAVLFDMDGTLVDSTAVVERTWRAFADRHHLDAERILAVSHGRRTEETVAAFAPPGVDTGAEARRLVAREVVDTEGIVAVPGAAELLASLPEDRWALVTSAGRDLTAARMGAAGLPMPPVVVCADDVSAGKPHPEGYLTAAARLGTAAGRTLVFEDAEAGLLAARASGARTVVVGPYAAAAAAGLDRVADLRCVRAGHAAGRLVLSYPASAVPPGGPGAGPAPGA
ncbi:sugar-phosphatase [Actinacidiphila yanglinensis]|uniref:Sugar-phosphatase n=1 Tax=Actinacidiphila yanglinensis TaxID=310779 RepID=A0A1H5TZD2_9ACTN|nr:HAD-IA family hydrolase [Actinacidiphila yanglinensis]SEF67377.1 sugar-phosphatase [Actinacidiphila yanglinensis]